MLSSAPYLFTELYDIFSKAPIYTQFLEVALVILVLWLIFHKANFGGGKRLTIEEKAALLERWMPEPLVGDVPADHALLQPRLVSGRVGHRITVDGVDCLNLASHNYLNFIGDAEIESSAIQSIGKYGVGSCGPRGFYGTVDVHLELEQRLAAFMGCEEACVYSYGFSTVASAIPSYCKRGDLVFVDENVNFAIQKGLDASRSKIMYFKHNDMADLERLLTEQQVLDNKNPKKAMRTRRFLIAEAIYMNTGEMCPLAKLVELRQRFKLRFILDEGISFGTIGKNGRGLTELLNIDRKEIDLICGTLEWAVGSIGGFCVGSTYIVDHQRLSGLGYCFSASAPPALTQAAIVAIDKFERAPEMFAELNSCAAKVQKKFSEFTRLALSGHPLSPVKHLYIESDSSESIAKIVEQCKSAKLAVVQSEYLNQCEKQKLRPSIRITVNRQLSDEDISFAFETLERVSNEVLQ